MPRRLPVLLVCLAALGLAGLAAGCSSSGGTAVTTPQTPTPAPTVSSQYNTLGTTTCTAPNDALPGYYVDFTTNGGVAGSTYTATDAGFNGYQMTEYTAAGASPEPTVPPLVPSPAPSPDALGIIYYGEYSVPAFTDHLDEGSTPIAATSGCFQFETVQALGGATPAPIAGYGVGFPAFSAPYPAETSYVGAPGAGTFSLSSFTITNLTRTTGSGTFVLPINGGGTVTGTVTVTGSTSYPTVINDESTSVRRHSQLIRH